MIPSLQKLIHSFSSYVSKFESELFYVRKFKTSVRFKRRRCALPRSKLERRTLWGEREQCGIELLCANVYQ